MLHLLKKSYNKVFNAIIVLKNIQFLYIITFLDYLLEGLQEFPTLIQIILLEIELK